MSDLQREIPKEKWCSKCHIVKRGAAFYKDRGSSDGLGNSCKDCMYPDRKPWNPQPRTCLCCQVEYTPKAGNQKYCSPACLDKNTQVARGRFVILERDAFRCVYCGKSSVEDDRELHVDHIVPREEGGGEQAKNLVTACKRCNLEKGKSVLNPQLLARLTAEATKRNVAQDIDPELVIKI